MGNSHSASSNACKISMLWNWNTIDSCFLARSWHVKSSGGFAGSCVGVFFLVLASQWLHRFCREYDSAIIRKNLNSFLQESDHTSSLYQSKEILAPSKPRYPLLYAVSHQWLFSNFNSQLRIIPSLFEHLVRTILFTLEWGTSYIIMLLFMYYNGYIIISCILGALFGRFIFTFNEPLCCKGEEDRALLDSEDSDRKCCR